MSGLAWSTIAQLIDEKTTLHLRIAIHGAWAILYDRVDYNPVFNVNFSPRRIWLLCWNFRTVNRG
jgi:hypothetical protein